MAMFNSKLFVFHENLHFCCGFLSHILTTKHSLLTPSFTFTDYGTQTTHEILKTMNRKSNYSITDMCCCQLVSAVAHLLPVLTSSCLCFVAPKQGPDSGPKNGATILKLAAQLPNVWFQFWAHGVCVLPSAKSALSCDRLHLPFMFSCAWCQDAGFTVSIYIYIYDVNIYNDFSLLFLLGFSCAFSGCQLFFDCFVHVFSLVLHCFFIFVSLGFQRLFGIFWFHLFFFGFSMVLNCFV